MASHAEPAPVRRSDAFLRPEDITFGLEEEIYVTSPTDPTLESLYYLARLLWRNPRLYYRHSDSNFARGRDVKHGLMSGVEVSTIRKSDPAAAVDDLRRCRRDLVRACGRSGVLLVAVGHLLDRDTPTNVCGMHIHIGVPAWARESAYRRLARFLPLLSLLTASSPCREGRYFGPSYRMVCGYATGALRQDPLYRFQDLIVSRRLGTIEARLFDPVWDLDRVETVLRSMQAVLLHAADVPLDYEGYATLRRLAAERGYGPEFAPLLDELNSCLALSDSAPVAAELFSQPPAAEIYDLYTRHGLAATYAALHHGYLGSATSLVAPERTPAARRASPLRTAGGVVGYYVVRLPYKLSKVLRESGREKVVRRDA